MSLVLKDRIEVRQNLKLELRERGKLVALREGHNIWLDLGREWLAGLMSLVAYNPDTPARDDRIKYMGVGIGGTRQLALEHANIPPITPPYGGSNIQTDSDPGVLTLERPVRVSGSGSTYPGLAGDCWLGRIQAPPVLNVAREVTYSRVFTELEVSYGPFASVPLSEVGLALSSCDPENYQNTLVAYDTFDTLSKTTAVALEVVWTLRF